MFHLFKMTSVIDCKIIFKLLSSCLKISKRKGVSVMGAGYHATPYLPKLHDQVHE